MALTEFLPTPFEATPEMIAAGEDQLVNGGDLADVWRSMHAAAPLPPSVAVLPATNVARRNPDFWDDLQVRNLVIDLHRQVTIAKALTSIRHRVGEARTPSKSALSRAWKRLDKADFRKGR